jgi:hypothetical protein
MVSVYSKNLQVYNAEQFKASVTAGMDSYVYLTFGKVSPWANDAEPPQANTSVDYFYDVWKNMIGAKRIQGNDIRLAVRRHDWEANTVYHEYTDCGCSLLQNNPNAKYFVVTSDWNVYKCISNNKGAVSSSKPTSILASSSVKYGDNYVWKYMYTLSDEERLRFVTNQYIPVKTLSEDDGSLQWQVQSEAKFGSIEHISILSGGSGYSTTVAPIITVTGDGSGATATATVNASTTAIERITITDPGQNYTYANVAISPSVSNSAILRAVMSPPGGHGKNPAEELGGSNVLINVRLRGEEEGILDVQNEFRQISLMKNPKLLGSEQFASNLVYSQTTTLLMDEGISNYVEDEYVFQGASLESATFRGTVASWTPANNRLELVDVIGNPTTDILTGETTKVSRYVESVIPKDLQPYSGSLLYINNIQPIQRAEDQTEDFKITISF